MNILIDSGISFRNFFCGLQKYISKNFDLSSTNPVNCLLPLNINAELSFGLLQIIAKECNFDYGNEDCLYEEFSNATSLVKIVKTGRIKQSCVNSYSDLKNKQIDVPKLNKILGFVLRITCSNVHTARVIESAKNLIKMLSSTASVDK